MNGRDSLLPSDKYLAEARLSKACSVSDRKDESAWTALGQLIIPFMIAGMGNVAAGIVLGQAQHWEVFEKIPQLLILVPALLGLKGNVEMTLASRLSTHANLGRMDTAKDLKSMVVANLALVQCQSSTVGLIAPLVAIALSLITNKSEHHMPLTYEDVILMTSSAVITANIANLLLGSLMCAVVIISRRFNINPDNIATPIAASVGDIATMLLLAYISHGLFNSILWLSTALLILLTLLTPVWAFIASKNKYTRRVLFCGWFPILGAMFLQNTGGLIMENGLSRYKRLAAFQPIINGVGGNLAAVQSSRISTYLHKENYKEVSLINTKTCVSPFDVFFGKHSHALMARLFVMISAPSHLIFISALRLIKAHFIFTAYLILFYLIAGLVQVIILLIICYYLVNILWQKGIDPDNSSIPFLTALADLLGSALLFLSFFVLQSLNDPNAFNDVISYSNITSISYTFAKLNDMMQNKNKHE